jgi:hypothetical protein
MNAEIGAEAAQFPEKEYINGIAVAVFAIACTSISAKFFQDKTTKILFHLPSSSPLCLPAVLEF